MAANFDQKLKIILVGDSAVGKSCILRRFMENKYDGGFSSTIGVDFKKKLIETPSGTRVLATIWDTAGQERFDSLQTGYYRGCDCAMIVFDITQRSTFNCINDRWAQALRENIDNIDDVTVVLVGCKYDLLSTQPGCRQVSVNEAESLVKENKWTHYFEVSAKNGYHIKSLFVTTVAFASMQKQLKQKNDKLQKENVFLQNKSQNSSQGGCC